MFFFESNKKPLQCSVIFSSLTCLSVVRVTSLIRSGAGWDVISEECAKRITCQDSQSVAVKIRWYTTLTVLLFLCPYTGKK